MQICINGQHVQLSPRMHMEGPRLRTRWLHVLYLPIPLDILQLLGLRLESLFLSANSQLSITRFSRLAFALAKSDYLTCVCADKHSLFYQCFDGFLNTVLSFLSEVVLLLSFWLFCFDCIHTEVC